MNNQTVIIKLSSEYVEKLVRMSVQKNKSLEFVLQEIIIRFIERADERDLMFDLADSYRAERSKK